MLKPLIAGAAALCISIGVAAAPGAAKADEDVLRGVLLGAAIGGVVAVIADNAHDGRRHYTRRYEPRRDVYVVKAPPRGRGHGYYGRPAKHYDRHHDRRRYDRHDRHGRHHDRWR